MSRKLFQNGASKVTLVLWPAMTIECLIKGNWSQESRTLAPPPPVVIAGAKGSGGLVPLGTNDTADSTNNKLHSFRAMRRISGVVSCSIYQEWPARCRSEMQ